MLHFQYIEPKEENDLMKFYEMVKRNFRYFLVCLFLSLGVAFLINRYSAPIYKISSSILIREDKSKQGGQDINDYLNSSLLGKNINFQNELWILKSSPVIENTIKNLELEISYYSKGRVQSYEIYTDSPFKVSFVRSHPQPINVRFILKYEDNDTFSLSATGKDVAFMNFEQNKIDHRSGKWDFNKKCAFGEMIMTPDLAFIIEPSENFEMASAGSGTEFEFEFRPIASIMNQIRKNLEFRAVDRTATVIEITMKAPSEKKGIDIVNELMRVYSDQNLERKNHIASITIDYIEKQLDEISDSLSQTEDNLQKFRSSNQLLNITDQATGISAQYMDLQNQLAELISRKRYYDYVSEMLSNDNFSNMMLPASIGISDQFLNSLIAELISAQTQRSNLIENNQERNPLVQKLGIQIENLKKTISENIVAVSNTTSISIEEMNNRIRKIQNEISRLPVTQRRLGNIERKYRLNDAIYNYMMQKHAEAKITKASNLPDDLIIEPARNAEMRPIKPNKSMNYLIALIMGVAIPFGFFTIRNSLKSKIEIQEDIERITKIPVIGKIMHNRYRTEYVMLEYPKSSLAESFRALRTNLEFFAKDLKKKTIMVTSSIENEGKSFVAVNLALSYAQLGKKTVLVDFDMRKQKLLFDEQSKAREGLSSYLIDKASLDSILMNTSENKLDYILSGLTPPNPAELIAMEKTMELMNTLKNLYEVIIIDTTPLAQVTDAYLMISHSDMVVIVTRQNVTPKNIFSVVLKDLQIKGIEKICIVLNDNSYFGEQYGYGYGYYNKKEKNPPIGRRM